jgi:hypothetical protein
MYTSGFEFAMLNLVPTATSAFTGFDASLPRAVEAELENVPFGWSTRRREIR